MPHSAEVLYQDETLRYSLFVAAILAFIILIPMEFVQVFRYYQVAPIDRVLVKRYPFISLTASISFTIVTVGSLVCVIFQSNIGHSSQYHSITWYIYMPIIAFCGAFVDIAAYAGAFRFWMIFFQNNISKIVLSHQWRVLINSSINIKDVSKHGQWFVKHKKDFGNYRYCKKLFIYIGGIGTFTSTATFVTLYVMYICSFYIIVLFLFYCMALFALIETVSFLFLFLFFFFWKCFERRLCVEIF